jgi:anti-sigma B factor antagonist
MSGDSFRISTAMDGGRSVLVPQGDLDLLTAPELEERLVEAMSTGETVLDLSGLSFIDSSGIALLVAVSRRARENGWRLRVERPSGPVARLIELTGVGELLGDGPG